MSGELNPCFLEQGTNYEKKARVNSSGEILIDKSSLATSSNQIDGSQKTQIVDQTNTNVDFSTEETLTQLNNAISAIRSVIGTAADLRVTLLSGVVTTVTTVTGITNLGGNPAIQIVPNIANMTYILANQENISLI